MSFTMRIIVVLLLSHTFSLLNALNVPLPPRCRYPERCEALHGRFQESNRRSQSQLFSSSDPSPPLSISEQQTLGVLGTVCAIIVFISEYTLASTGCGVPAGPYGLFGLAEGISYLGVVGVAGYSAFTKIRTGSGLPAGPAGLLEAAEGLSFLAILVGLIVLFLQVNNYGYIPNAVPMEGGMCQ